MAKRPAASQSSNSLRALAPSRDISPSSREGAKARSRVLGEELPRGWTMAELRHLVTDVQPGFACGVHNREGAGVGHLRPMNVTEDGCVSLDVLKYVPEDQVDREQRLARSGDVIFNNTNSPELVGKTALYDLPEPRGSSNHMTRLRCSGALDPAFCAMQLHQNWRIGYFISVCNNHVSQASVSSSVLLNTLMRLPPLPAVRHGPPIRI